MKGVLCIICFLSDVISIQGLATRIFNGWDASEGQYPYHANVIAKTKTMASTCGGSIIDKRWILTAAHCFKQFNYKDIQVRVGTVIRVGPSGRTYRVDKLIIHENFKEDTFENDIALLRLHNNIIFNDNISPVRLADSTTTIGDNENVIFTGFGDMEDHQHPERLQTVILKMFGYRRCKQQEEDIKETQICTIPRGGRGPCAGDSGGPLVNENYVQVGIDSHAYGEGIESCAQIPEIYTRVSSYRDWIDEKINSNYVTRLH